MSRENFDSQNGRASSIKLFNKGLSSIFSSVKNKIREFFLPNKEDDQKQRRSPKEFSPERNFEIHPGYINNNQHIYEAPTLMAETDLRSKKSQVEPRINHRRLSTESHKTNSTRKKVHSVIKIAHLITNGQFNKGKTGYTNYTFDKDSSYPKSAFKILDGTYKNFSFQKRKIINCKDFQESVLKDSNIHRPIPIKASEEEFRAISQKRERPSDAMSVDRISGHHLKTFKKQKIDDDNKTIFSQISSLHKFRIHQKEDASMNTVTQSLRKRDDVSMRSIPEAKSVFSRSSYPKTIDELKKEIEDKRNNNRKIYDEISQRSSKRQNNFKHDFEERRKILSNYYKEKEKSYQDINILHENKQNETNVFNLNESNLFDTKDNRRYTLSQSSITIPSSSKERKNEEMVISKNEEFNINSVDKGGINTQNSPLTITKINAPISKVELPNKLNTFGSAFGDNNILLSFGKKENALENIQNNLQTQSNNLTDKKEAQEEKKTFGSLFGGDKLGTNKSENIILPEIKNNFTAEINKTSKPNGSMGFNNQSIFNRLEESNKDKDKDKDKETGQVLPLVTAEDKKPLFSGISKKEEVPTINTSYLFGSKPTTEDTSIKPQVDINKKEESKIPENSKPSFETTSLLEKKDQASTTNTNLINTPNPLNLPSEKTTSLFGENLGIGGKVNVDPVNTFSSTPKPLNLFGTLTNSNEIPTITETKKETTENKSDHTGINLGQADSLKNKLFSTVTNEVTKPEMKTGLFGLNTEQNTNANNNNTSKSLFGSNVSETKIGNIPTENKSPSNLSFGKPSPTLGETQPTQNSSSLCNPSNPFLSAINPTNQVSNLFSPSKNTQSDQQNSNSHSFSNNQFIPKSSQNNNKDIFGAPNPTSSSFGLFNSKAPPAFNTSNDEMAISPVTSPKTASRTDNVEVSKIPYLFGSTSQLGGIGLINAGVPGSNLFSQSSNTMKTNNLFPKPQTQDQNNQSTSTPQTNNLNNSIFGNPGNPSIPFNNNGLFGVQNQNQNQNPNLKMSFSLGKKENK